MPVYDTDVRLGEVFEVAEGDTRQAVYLRDISLAYRPRPDLAGGTQLAVKVSPGDNDEEPQFFLRAEDGSYDSSEDSSTYRINLVVEPLPVSTVWQQPSGSSYATHTYAYDQSDGSFNNLYSTSHPIVRNEEDIHPVVVPTNGVNDLFLLEFGRTLNTIISGQYFGDYTFKLRGNENTAGQYPPDVDHIMWEDTILAEYRNSNSQSLHAACYDQVNHRIIIYLWHPYGGNSRHEFWEMTRLDTNDRASDWDLKRISAHDTIGATVGFTGIIQIPTEHDNEDGTKFLGNDYTNHAPHYRLFREITIPTGLPHSSSYTDEQVSWTTPSSYNWAASSSQEAINNGRCLSRIGTDLYVTNPPSDGSTSSNNILRRVRMLNDEGDFAPSMVAVDDSEVTATPSAYTSEIDLFAMFPNTAEQTIELELVGPDGPIDEEILYDNRYKPSGDDDRGSPKQVRFQFISEDEDNRYALPASVTVDGEETDLTFDDEHQGEQHLLGQFTTVRLSEAPEDSKTNLTLSALREIHSPHISPWASMLTVWVGDRDDPDFIKRYTTYNEPITHDGSIYVPHQFTATFPPRTRSTEVEVSLTLTNVTGELDYLLTADTQYVQAESFIVRVHEPSVAQYGPVSHVYRELKQSSGRLIQMTGKIIDIIDDPAVEEQYTPAYFPGLF